MKHNQCVKLLRPEICPNSGRTGVNSKTSFTFTCVSFHLKIKTPSVAKTRKHSEKPFRRSSRQFSESFPYFAAIQLFPPARTRCGGSKATSLKEPSGYGSARKSIRASGSIFSVRVPILFPCERSVTVSVSDRQSPNITSGFSLSNHIILEPQHGSSIFLFIILLIRAPNNGAQADPRSASGVAFRWATYARPFRSVFLLLLLASMISLIVASTRTLR